MRKLTLITVVLAVGLASSCGSTPIMNAGDSMLVGVWITQHDETWFGYSVIEYQSNGDKCEVATTYEPGLGFEVTLYWNKWELRDTVVYTTMHATNSGIPIGRQINDKVLKLNDTEFTAIMIQPRYDDVTNEVHLRQPTAEAGEICGVVIPLLSAERP